MPDWKKFLSEPIIQISIAVGVSILAIATSTIWLPMRWFDPMLLTVPPLIEVVFGALYRKHKGARFMKTWYWCCAILVSTALLILSRKL
jgi:hypothetical protein